MTSAADTDIRKIKDLIAAGNAVTQKQIDNLANSTQKQISDLANTTQRQIDRLFATTEANTKAIESLTKGTDANAKAIADLTASFTGLREEVRVGFTKVEGEFRQVDREYFGAV